MHLVLSEDSLSPQISGDTLILENEIEFSFFDSELETDDMLLEDSVFNTEDDLEEGLLEEATIGPEDIGEEISLENTIENIATDQSRIFAEEMANDGNCEELLNVLFDMSGDMDEYVSLESLTTATNLERAEIKLVEYSSSEDGNDSTEENTDGEDKDDVASKGEHTNQEFETEIENATFLYQVELDTVPISMDGGYGEADLDADTSIVWSVSDCSDDFDEATLLNGDTSKTMDVARMLDYSNESGTTNNSSPSQEIGAGVASFSCSPSAPGTRRSPEDGPSAQWSPAASGPRSPSIPTGTRARQAESSPSRRPRVGLASPLLPSSIGIGEQVASADLASVSRRSPEVYLSPKQNRDLLTPPSQPSSAPSSPPSSSPVASGPRTPRMNTPSARPTGTIARHPPESSPYRRPHVGLASPLPSSSIDVSSEVSMRGALTHR